MAVERFGYEFCCWFFREVYFKGGLSRETIEDGHKEIVTIVFGWT